MSEDSDVSYFLVLNGERRGPFPAHALHRKLTFEEITPETLCWREGMSEWLPLKDVPGAMPPPREEGETLNPYAPPKAALEVPSAARLKKGGYGGIGRGAYFGASLLLGVLQLMITQAVEGGPGGEERGLAVAALMAVFSVALVYQRVKNIGMNPWWCLLILVPIANLVIGIRCLVCQEGYADVRKLDDTGRILAWIVGIFVALAVVSLLLVVSSL